MIKLEYGDYSESTMMSSLYKHLIKLPKNKHDDKFKLLLSWLPSIKIINVLTNNDKVTSIECYFENYDYVELKDSILTKHIVNYIVNLKK